MNADNAKNIGNYFYFQTRTNNQKWKKKLLWLQYYNASQIYKTIKPSWSERKFRTFFSNCKIFGEFYEDSRNFKAGSKKDSNTKYTIRELISNRSRLVAFEH